VATAFAGGDEVKGAEWKIGADDIAEAVVDPEAGFAPSPAG
jgi:hypothetical protein